MDEQVHEDTNPAEEPGSWSVARVIGVLLILLVAVALIYLLVGYLAWESGQTLRGEREQALRLEQYARQISLAQEDIQQGGYNLALTRLNWVLERDPGNAEALALQSQAQAALRTALTPIAPPTATPEPEPTVMLGEETDPDTELARLDRLYQREQYPELLAGVLAFQRQFPDFNRLETDRLRYEAYLNLGLQHIQGEQIELGINYLAQAEKLGDLPQEALDYWLWAELYLEGIAYFGVNWAVSVSVFRDLCLSAPFFQNACNKFFESLVSYGDQYLFNQDYCPAVELFREARQYGNDAALGEKLTSAIEGCSLATATPETITGTVPITVTDPLPLPVTNE